MFTVFLVTQTGRCDADDPHVLDHWGEAVRLDRAVEEAEWLAKPAQYRLHRGKVSEIIVRDHNLYVHLRLPVDEELARKVAREKATAERRARLAAKRQVEDADRAQAEKTIAEVRALHKLLTQERQGNLL